MVKYFNKDINHEQELLNAFKVFDKNKEGTVNSEELLHHLTHLGEKFTEDQIKDFSGIFEKNNHEVGKTDYVYITKLITRSANIGI